jgi:cell wall-associated NlpC family hydrolase
VIVANESVTVDFNANVDGYTQSLQQALAATQQFSSAADFGAGKLAKLNNASFALIKQLNSITGANKTAAAQAAAYQEKISGLEATTVAAGKKMEGLAKTSMAFARQFPVGMDKSIEVVKTLQTAGVTTTKQIDQLGKTFIKLQAATGEWGSGMISDMVQITRAYGNGSKTVSGFSDSLTTVTAKYGASASAALSFAKTLAPVTSVIGISQSSVLGLSTAFSSMGEDGYRSANALNKIFLDLDKSVRTGTPEAREYAKAMGMTSESLTKMFKNDPTETFIKFTEAIKSQGKDSIRTLDNLGLEGIATFKALQTASNVDLRGMVTTSNQAYGSGSTEKAAAKALGGVNDEMAKLSEVMSQTVSAAGTPFLEMLGKVLSAANSFANMIQKIVASPFGTFLTAAAAAAGVLFTAMKGIATINFARLALAPMLAGFKGGAKDLASGVKQSGSDMANAYRAIPGPVSSESAAMMTKRAQMMYNLGQGPLGQGFNNAGGGISGVAGGLKNMALFGGTAAMNMQTNFLRYSPDQQIVRTDAGKALSSNLAAAKIDPVTGGAASLGQQLKGMTAAFATFGKTITGATATTGSQFAGLGAAAKGLTGAFVRSAAELTITMGKMAFSMMAQMAVAMLPMIAIMGAIMGIMKIIDFNKKQNERKEQVGENFKNANANYNEFAEKSGLASRELVALAEAAKETTLQLNQQNKTKKDALNVTDKERGDAQSGSYVTSMGISKDATPEETANQIRMLVGKNADPAALAKAMGDVVAQKGVAYQEQVKSLYAKAEADPYTAGLKNVSANYGFNSSRTDESVKRSGDLQGEMTRNVDQISKVYGSQITEIAKLAEAKKIYDAAKKGGAGEKEAAKDILQAQFGADTSNIYSTKNFDEYMKSIASKDGKARNQQQIYAATKAKNINLDNVDYNSLSPQTTIAKQDSLAMAQRIAGAKGLEYNTPMGPDLKLKTAAEGLAVALNSAEDAARKNGTTVRDMSESVKKGLKPLEKAMVELGQAPNSIVAQTNAGTELAKSAMQNNKNGMAAIADLRAQQATLTQGDEKRSAIEVAIRVINSGLTATRAGQTMTERTSEAIDAGKIARAQGVQNNIEDENARQATIQGEQNAYAERVSFAKQFIEAKHNLDKQLRRQNEEYNRSVLISNRDFNLQIKYQQADFNTNRKRQGEDFAKSFNNPYQRIMAVKTTDAAGVLSNLKQQNASLKTQMANVKKLRKLGLSQQSIDTLDLMNPNNAQEVARLTQNLENNHAELLSINQETATRGKLSQQYVNSPYNQSTTRANEEYDKQMTRAKDQHKTALADMAVNLKIARSHAYQDLMDFGYEAHVPADKVAETMDAAFATIPDSAKTHMSAALQAMVAAGQSFDGTTFTVSIGTTGGGSSANSSYPSAGSGYSGAGGNYGSGGGSGSSYKPSNAGSGGENAGILTNTANYSTNTKGYTSASDKGGQIINGVAARNNFTSTTGLGGARLQGNTYQVMDKTGKYQNVVANDGKTLRSKFLDAVFDQIGQPYITGGGRKKTDTEGFDCSGLVDYAATRAGIKGFGSQTAAQLYSQTKRIGEKELLPGDLVFYDNNSKKPGMDHVGVYAGYGKMINAPRPDANINVSPIRFNGSGNPIFGRFKDKNFADGGIVTQPTNALIGEAGYPEAVVPLNNRGANILADAMGMYLDNYDAMSSRMQPYASSTHNYSSTQYDQSTQINGQITVQAQDPNEFLRKIQAKQRRQRLVQPVGN